VVVSIFGDDLDLLDAKAQQVAATLRAVSGAEDVQIKSPPGSPRIAVRLRPERLLPLGFRPVEVLEAVQTSYQGTVVAQTYRGNQVADVLVILDEPNRRDPENVGHLLVSSPSGLRVPLRELADVFATSGRHSILHDGGRRRQTVTCNVSGRDIAAFVADARGEMGTKVSLPRGTYLTVAGAAEAASAARQQLLTHSGIAAVGIILLLAVVLRRAANVLLVLANVPFALVGGVLAVWLAGEGGLNLGALVGFVTLFGITMRNSIMLISHYEHLVQREGASWSFDTAVRGATQRLVPILMTALVTGLGLLPLALGSGEAGREIEGPMAIVILGGLVTSTVLNLIVLPTLALRFGHFAGDPESAGSASVSPDPAAGG
jgi:Cu/Ag efflux pump CusA